MYNMEFDFRNHTKNKSSSDRLAFLSMSVLRILKDMNGSSSQKRDLVISW